MVTFSPSLAAAANTRPAGMFFRKNTQSAFRSTICLPILADTAISCSFKTQKAAF